MEWGLECLVAEIVVVIVRVAAAAAAAALVVDFVGSHVVDVVRSASAEGPVPFADPLAAAALARWPIEESRQESQVRLAAALS